jgi:hypothetical protein
VVAGSKSSSTVATTSVVEAPGVMRRSGRPTTKEDHRGEHCRSSMMCMPPQVDTPGAVQRSGRPAAEEDRR